MKKNQTPINPFECYATEYDDWFDTDAGKSLFLEELRCLRQAVTASYAPWLEVGVGSGRFAQALGILAGVEPAEQMANIARQRGLDVRSGRAEAIPFPDSSFKGLLLACAFCFLTDPDKSMQEFFRVLQPGGRLVIGFIPANSPWGAYHASRGEKGHIFYRSAKFYTAEKITTLGLATGFIYLTEYPAELPEPAGQLPPTIDRTKLTSSSFAALVLQKPA